MTLGIVTVYKSRNCGSYLQAWALQRVLEGSGHDVCFVEYHGRSDNVWDYYVRLILYCCCFRFKNAGYLIRRNRMFREAQKAFRTIDSTQADLYLYGSDTLWNFEGEFFKASSRFFLGQDVKRPKATYAVSAGSTSQEDFEAVEGIAEAIRDFQAVSVRDEHTLQLAQSVSGRQDIVKALDPTMLLEPADYEALIQEKPAGDYLFVYYFGRMSEELYHQMENFARERGLRIIRMGTPDKRFSTNITNDPSSFLTYFAGAQYVVTNTFHGCVFSILFNKQFVTDGYGKKKVQDLIESFRLSGQYLNQASDLDRLLDERIDYEAVNREIEVRRQESLDYLYRVVGDIETKDPESR
ncbi:MAG: polysaccharide pyruvyl transferase family protein [Candidatus Gastranaerophilales bacterium]|nr:polysaccharide pyruvyl transferase family protein [Candidatus Gastranaerophilales bacterium]